jgi:hypothetical protein
VRPQLVVAVEIPVGNDLPPGSIEHRVGPIAPTRDRTTLLSTDPLPEPLSEHRRRSGMLDAPLRTRETVDQCREPCTHLRTVQCGDEPRQLLTRTVAVDAARRLEQRPPRCPPRDEQDRVPARGGHLWQERHPAPGKPCQDPDLMRDTPCGSRRPRELDNVIGADSRARRPPHRIVRIDTAANHDRLTVQFRGDDTHRRRNRLW